MKAKRSRKKAHKSAEKWLINKGITAETGNYSQIYQAYLDGYASASKKPKKEKGPWIEAHGHMPKLGMRENIDIKHRGGWTSNDVTGMYQRWTWDGFLDDIYYYRRLVA